MKTNQKKKNLLVKNHKIIKDKETQEEKDHNHKNQKENKEKKNTDPVTMMKIQCMLEMFISGLQS